jgi:peptidoglycan/xylan/chitin deacetylase (PgdA/CDA1 family)
LRATAAIVALLCGALPILAAPPVPHRAVAFTFDDIPGLHPGPCNVRATEKMNRDLVAAIRRNKMPALGVVVDNRPCEGRRNHIGPIFDMWLDAGLELGNHTASHRDFNIVPLDEFQQDTIAGEKTLKPLLERRGKKIRYFRFPMLRTGTELPKKRAFEQFLGGRGYTNAVVTIDNDDYIYAYVYGQALNDGDVALAKRIATDYLRYMETIFVFYEALSRDVLGYEIPQVLLLHDNRLNADQLDGLAAMARKRGYRLISIDEALRDPAYRRRDAYVGRRGLSWLHRWALDDGKTPPDQPEVPGWIAELFRKMQR